MTTRTKAKMKFPSRRRFTVDEYYKMAEASILNEDDRVELIDGEVIQMPPIGPRHAGGVDRTGHLLFQRFNDVAHVRIQGPVRLDEHDEPEPDFALLRPRADYYSSGHPTAADVFLLIEVADTTGRYDRQVKAQLYAGAGIPDYWVQDVARHTLTVHRDPAPEGYRSVQTLRRGDHIAPLAFSDRTLAVSDMLGEPPAAG